MENLQKVAEQLNLSSDYNPLCDKFYDVDSYPLKTLCEMLQFNIGICTGLHPRLKPNEITPSTNYCRLLNGRESETAFLRSSVPKTLVCHDYKGGYLNDRLFNGVDNGEKEFVFTAWLCTDIFVYFSHNLVTIPPYSWINAGHSHGVPVLGTLITEGKDGKAIWDQILPTNLTMNWFVDCLVLIAREYGFDGYLLNVENKLDPPEVPKLLDLIKLLRERLPPSSYLIWYDSVIDNGDLKWQNELNKKNIDFFNACDGIYINYNYSNVELMTTALNAAHRKHDVFVGVDVFGRGCPGRGFASYVSMEMIRRYELSAAIFAPGWTEEAIPGDPVFNEHLFWSSLRKYVYFHGLVSNTITTNFSQGQGDIIAGQPNAVSWFNLNKFDVQVLLPPLGDIENEEFVLAKLTSELFKAKDDEKSKMIDDFYKLLPSPLLSINFDDALVGGSCLKVDIQGKASSMDIPLFLLDNKAKKVFALDIIIKRISDCAKATFYLIAQDSKLRQIRIIDSEYREYDKEGWTCCQYRFPVQGRVLELGLVPKPGTCFLVGQIFYAIH